MADNHRNKKWDEYIGKRVRVEFRDGHILIGVLNYSDGFYKMQSAEYFSQSLKVHRIYRTPREFRKSTIKQIDLLEV